MPVIIIFAPTASGKTALTRELFSPKGSHFIFKAEVVSADSQAVYRGMDIGTAKPDKEFCKELPHHLIDILNPDQQCNVSDYIDEADKACKEIYSRGAIPLLCGGTGYYIRNFLYGVAQTPMSDQVLRNKLKKRIIDEGNEALYQELSKIDPQSAAKIHPNDAYRICRALEVYYLSGQTRSSFKREEKLRELYDFLFIVLQPERELLYQRIRQRVDLMFDMGLKKEVQELLNKGYTKESPGLKAIGYSEWFQYDDEDKVREEIKHHSCKYAKKQYTYIRDIPGSYIFDYSGKNEDIEKIAALIKEKFKNYF
ncbi:MAG: tRNA (adenosine(37)-N6)-dimethylallyltransferase MiaA [Treponema sp.]|nr:tRNA (adenosine(37)-N6)-dimethylallyltransferase MiaA [Treponema sp.]